MKTRLSSTIATIVMMVLLLSGLALAQGKVDINTADVNGLMSLKGIGEAKAKAIVKYREMNGRFTSLEDLQGVPGIGEKTIADNKSMIAIGKGAGATGKKGTAKAGKAKAEKSMTGASEKSKKAMKSEDKAKDATKGTSSTAEKAMTDKPDKAKKAKKAMTDTKEKAKKGMPSTKDKAKKTTSTKK